MLKFKKKKKIIKRKRKNWKVQLPSFPVVVFTLGKYMPINGLTVVVVFEVISLLVKQNEFTYIQLRPMGNNRSNISIQLMLNIQNNLAKRIN